MHLTQQDKKAAKDGFKYVVVRGGKRVAYTTTVAEGKRECGKTGRVVSIAGMTYAAQNPAAKAKRRNPSRGAAEGSVEKFVNASGQTGWLVYDRHGRRVGLYANKALALEVLASANSQRRNPSSGAAKGAVEKFINASGQTGWLVYDRHGRRVGFYANKALALEVLASANSQRRNPAPSRKMTQTIAFREAYYKIAEGIAAMEWAIDQTHVTKGDAELKRLLKSVDLEFDKFYEYLNTHYIWD